MSSVLQSDDTTHVLQQQMREANAVGSELKELLTEHRNIMSEDTTRDQVRNVLFQDHRVRIGLDTQLQLKDCVWQHGRSPLCRKGTERRYDYAQLSAT